MIAKKLLLLFLQNRRRLLKYNQAQPNSILIRPLGNAIGDAVVHTAHLQQLKSAFPNTKIGVIVTEQNKIIFEHSHLVDEYIHRNIISYIRNYKKWDWLLDFENNFNSASLFMDRILTPNIIIIFRKKYKKYYNLETVKSYDIHYEQKDHTPLSHYLSYSPLAKQFSLPAPYSVLYPSDFSRKKVKVYWEVNKLKILLCPQGSKRQIPENELAELLTSAINSKYITQVELMISYTNTADDYYRNLVALCPQFKIIRSPKTSLSEYLALIESADIVLAVDGGSLHLACALKKPLLSFFANSQPNLSVWTPLVHSGTPHINIINHSSCNSNDTTNFPLEKAIDWLHKEIEEQLDKKSLLN
ncbi:glycosyltransferase family 9 protein [Pelistega sp. NLN82]|uniref:Glycosyltransferase family 9 protein n=1 Tax=Pelistega ratti TaxID=2652177 RepID=A0A6L9Y4H7_9BURK|nr:glycosyltransferase family 9 protein [Pelistega ratti]NEN75095.1 glycosyltransferase family 9 protein [Pelistega ratti]